MSFRGDLEKAIAALSDERTLFDPVDLLRHLDKVTLVAHQENAPTKSFSVAELAVYLRKDGDTPEYIGVEYLRQLSGAIMFDDGLAVVDVEPELRQVWTVKHGR